MSSARHFNDYSEIEYAYELLHSLLEETASESTEALERAFAVELTNKIRADEHCETYVLCFSTKFDDLNQWRSYASPGLGYCIGFPTTELQKFAERNSGRLAACVYDRNEQAQIIRFMLRREVSELSSYFPYFGPGEVNEGLVQLRVLSFRSNFSRIVPLFKNPAFRDESEVRLVFDAAKYPDGVRFRSGATSIVPFVEIQLDRIESESLVPSVVVVKTCSRPEFVAEAARKFLPASKYEQVSVSASAIPYREGL